MNQQYKHQFLTSIKQVNRKQWNAIVNNNYPFARYEFLSALELSESTNKKTGWEPRHLIIKSDDKINNANIVAIVILFIKDHSYGEYVFDFQWANAFHHSGLEYYPKLLTAIPFTPATGPRVFIKDDLYDLEFVQYINQLVVSYCEENKLSSWHVLFPEKKLSEQLANIKPKKISLFQRTGVQFHWENNNYQSFDDFLMHCRIKKRKNIKRERKQVYDSGLEISTIEGSEISFDFWQDFYRLYQMTYLKRSGQSGYLTASFFDLLHETMSEKIIVSVAKKKNKIIAAAFFLKSDSVLYGRYWGCLEEYNFLHFELCYYQGIEYCIKHKLERFDAGAQGEHKIARGFTPIETYSNHWVANPDFSMGLERFVNEEKPYVKQAINHYKKQLPFKLDNKIFNNNE